VHTFTAFEKAFADYCGVKYSVAVCNGTVVCILMLVLRDLVKVDEVIIPSFTMARPLFQYVTQAQNLYLLMQTGGRGI
jgi:dTDP-4-amino-4,6-dideoxygalactose transaminase